MKNANLQYKDSPTHIRVNGRVSFPSLFTPRSNPSDPSAKPKYQCTIIVSKDDTQAVNLIRNAEEAAKALYVSKYGKPSGKLKTTVYDGDEERPDDPTVANCLYIRCSSQRKPGVKLLENGMIVDALEESEVYAGCYGAAEINFFCYSAPSSKGISAGLNAVLKLEDGPRLNGGMNADEAFADLV